MDKDIITEFDNLPNRLIRNYKKVLPDIWDRYVIPVVETDITTPDIVYTDEDHVYRNATTKEQYKSSTQIVREFVPEKNFTTWGSQRKYKWTAEEVRTFWHWKGQRAINLGNYQHTLFDIMHSDPDWYYDELKDAIPDAHIVKIMNDIEALTKDWEITTENLHFNHDLKIAGRSDGLAIKGNKRMIIDLKTNRKELSFKNKYKQNLLDPFADLPANSMGEYTLQLNIYKMMEEITSGEAIDGLIIIHTYPEVNIIDVPMIDSEILYNTFNDYFSTNPYS